MSEIIAGKYKVIRPLGEGAFGRILLVSHTDLGHLFALKLLKKALSENEQFVNNFKQEAGILLKFSHPGSAQLRDFGRTEDGLFYMATDFYEGANLDDVIVKQGRFDPTLTLQIMLQLLDVLDAAHNFGIIHRDIKPANIIIQYDADNNPIARLLDFGIARLKDEIGGYYEEGEKGTIGTPAYMSPEQASGEPELDTRVDIYACGIVMYELLTGRVPFEGPTVVETLLRQLTQPVPTFPPELGIPDYIEAVMRKALEKERGRRFQTARDFSQSCQHALSQLSGQNAPVLRETISSTVFGQTSEAEPIAEKKILCLDDDEMILQILRHVLEKEGYHVFTCTNFAVIHDYIFTQRVPIMFCDINMPGLPGTKICKMLKQVKKSLKIILFSNMPDRDLERLAKESNADAWLSKNTRPGDWIAKVKEIESTVDWNENAY